MELPELPEPFFWEDERRDTINYRHGADDYENVAWFWAPGDAGNQTGKFEVYSAPVGVTRSDWAETRADTEEEAINMIVAFALMGVTKDG